MRVGLCLLFSVSCSYVFPLDRMEGGTSMVTANNGYLKELPNFFGFDSSYLYYSV